MISECCESDSDRDFNKLCGGHLIIVFPQVNTTVLAGESGHHFRPTVHVPLFRKGIRLAMSPFKSENPEGVEIEIVLTIYLFF